VGLAILSIGVDSAAKIKKMQAGARRIAVRSSGWQSIVPK
jgi:hypothetical protein